MSKNKKWVATKLCSVDGATDEDIARFWSYVEKTDDCWIWTGTVNRGGYGRVAIQGRQWNASRFVFALVYGDIPPGLLVCHRCDNPPCVRPDHLFQGTHKDNAVDAVLKGRTIGVNCANHKLTEEQVMEIRTTSPRLGYRIKLGEKFGVHPDYIYQVVCGKYWSHLPLARPPYSCTRAEARMALEKGCLREC